MLNRSRFFENSYQIDNYSKEELEFDLKSVKGRWIPEIVEKITKLESPENVNSNGDLYVGGAGIAYAFYHANQVSSNYQQNYLQLAQRYLQPALHQLDERRANNQLSPGLLCGDGGIILIAAVVAASIGDTRQRDIFVKNYIELAKICRTVNFSRTGSDEFFVGRAGYIYGALWLNKKLGRTAVPLDIIHELAKVTIISGKNYATKNSSPCPLMYSYYDREYLGAAHGLCSILQTLIQIPDFLDMNTEADSLVHSCVDYLLSLETPSSNYPCSLDEIEYNSRSDDGELVHWCHGAPGMVYLLAAAFLRWQDQRYMDACKRAADLVWFRGLLRKGPGICHGISGNGYVFLLLHRLTGDPIYLKRAVKFAVFLRNSEFQMNARTPDNPFSLYEGIAGTLCFLADLEYPEQAAFPFQDIYL